MYNANCDWCMHAKSGVNQLREEMRTIKDFRKLMKRLGWKEVVMENGGVWDFCPSCYAEHLLKPKRM